VAEAVFASKKIEEFPLIYAGAPLTLSQTKVMDFSKQFFVGNGPRDSRNRDCNEKE
jgi:hypothetical protein